MSKENQNPIIQVRAEATPNPATMKFQFSQRLGNNSLEFTDPRDADTSPLAQKLFGFPWTSSVFVGPDFITVTKQDWVEWEVLAEPLQGLIAEHFADGGALWSEILPNNDEDSDDPPIVKRIKEVLNREIRPVVAMDGGDVVFAKFEESVLYLQMRGACMGCPSSQATLKEGIEVRMRELIPEVQEVQSL